MSTKPLKTSPSKTNSLVDRIRSTKSRTVTIRSPVIEPVDGKVTVLSLSSGKTPLGTVSTRTREEASRNRGTCSPYAVS